MGDNRDFKQFLRDLTPEQFRKFVSAFGGEAKLPHEIEQWVTSVEREKQVCDKIRQLFDVEILTATERQEYLAKVAADASRRQAAAAEKANETAENALRVAEASMYWTKVATIVAGAAFVLGVLGLFK